MVLQRFLWPILKQLPYSIRKRFQHTSSTKMQNAYIRHTSASEKFALTFHYVNDSLGIDRTFNLCRAASETVSTLLSRIQANVEKIYATKRRKVLKKMAQSQVHDSSPPSEVTVELFRSGIPVPYEETCESLLESKDLVMLSLNGKKYHVVVNPPWVDKLELPTSILSGFPVYPCKFIGSNMDRSDSVFMWYKRPSEDTQWKEVGPGFIYTPSVEDIDHFLKVTCQPKRGMISGPIVEAESKTTIEAGPGECPFELRHAFTKDRVVGDCFRVMTYNILAGMYSDTDAAKTELFAHCPAYALDISYRKQLLMKEISGYNADIICLQEVDQKIFENDLEPILALGGFNGVFSNKGTLREGLACFANSNRFRLVHTYVTLLSAELSTRACYQNLYESVKNNDALLVRLKEKMTTSQATVLQSLDFPQKWLVVGNTHLYFHPDADHVRLLQSGQTILFIEEVVNKVRLENPGADVSVIFCGDFNSTPECGVYQLMTTGSAPDDLADWKSNEKERISGLSLSQPFQFGSACGTPPFTNYTVGFVGCLDYIFYEKNSLDVKEVFPIYSEEELQRYTALPNIVFPSDHVALVSDIQWSKKCLSE